MIFFFNLPIACPGFKPFGQVFEQFIIDLHRYNFIASSTYSILSFVDSSGDVKISIRDVIREVLDNEVESVYYYLIFYIDTNYFMKI